MQRSNKAVNPSGGRHVSRIPSLVAAARGPWSFAGDLGRSPGTDNPRDHSIFLKPVFGYRELTDSETAMHSYSIVADVAMYLATPKRLVRLTKRLSFCTLPRLNEFIKIKNQSLGDYFAFLVVQITHKEDGVPELWIHTSIFLNGRTRISFWPEEELDEWIASYEEEGWELQSDVENRMFREDDGSMVLDFCGIR
jgi:hypothetical protein